jgi:hypothetical protein
MARDIMDCLNRILVLFEETIPVFQRQLIIRRCNFFIPEYRKRKSIIQTFKLFTKFIFI